MRTLFLSLLCLFGALTVLQAQDPGIAYQAVARDADGDPLADAELNVRVTLYSADGATLWQESHASVLTNQFGNLALTIGDGAVTPGFSALSAVDWSAAGLHFGIEVDPGDGYASFGDVDVQAVPIAMYALNGQEEEIAALQSQLDLLDGDVSALASDLGDAVAEQENDYAFLLGLIEDNDGDISILQSNVSQNTADLGDLFSVISVDPTGITVEDLTVTGELEITGVFSAATGIFNYLSSNNADFEDMIAEAAQVAELTFVSGRALGETSELDIDGVLNVDGNSTMGGSLDVDGTITSQGSLLATEAYVDGGDAAVQADVDANEADSDSADAAIQSDVDGNEADSDSADAAIQSDVDGNEADSDSADAAIQSDVDGNEADSDSADATLQSNLEAGDAAVQSDVDANEADSDSADATLQSNLEAGDAAIQSDVDGNEADSDSADAAIQSDVDGNEADSDSADAALQGGVDANASDINDNEFRIAAAAADMGFGESTVGSVNNVPQHPGYANANYLGADDNLVEADSALDAALKSNADSDAQQASDDAAALALNASADAAESLAGDQADAAIQSDVDGNEAASIAADGVLQSNIDAEEAARILDVDAEENRALAAEGVLQDNIDAEETARIADVNAEESRATAAEGVLQGNIDAEESARISADNALQGQIDTNDDDILALQNGLAAEITQRGLGDALNQNAISTLNAQLGLLDGEMHDSIASLTATDEYLEDLINQIPGSVYEVESIVEANDYFDDNGSTVYLEEAYDAISVDGSMMANTASFDAMDAQDIDVDDAEIQNLTVESNVYSPNGTIDELNTTDLTVYETSDLQGAVTAGSTVTVAGATTLNSTLDVSGETTLGANASVTGDVTVSGNVTASDATAATHLASFGQLTTAADSLQENIEDVQADVDQNELDSDSADTQLQTNIDAVQTDVDNNQTASENADTQLQTNIDAVQTDVDNNQTASEGADTQLQTNIDAVQTDVDNNQTASEGADTQLQTNIDAVQTDVDNNQTASENADALLNDRADSLATAVANNDTDIQNLQDELDATQTGAGLNADGTYTANAAANYTSAAGSLTGADDALDAGLQAEVERATTREDSIIDVLYWNLDGDELTLDAGITDLEIGDVDIHARLIQADGLTSETVTTEIITADEATLEEINTDDLTAQVGHVADLTWNHARALGSSSTTTLDGSLDVDGTTNLDTTYVTEYFEFDGSDENDSLIGDFNVAARMYQSYVEEYVTVAEGNISMLAPGGDGSSGDEGDNGNIALGAENSIYLDASGDGEDSSLHLDSMGIALDSWFTSISDSLRVGGNADFDATLNVDGNATVGGTLAVTGTASAANAVADSDLITKGQSDTRDDSLANAIAGNDQDIIDLNGRADSLANAVAGNDSDIVDLNGRADSLANAVAGNDSDIVDLNGRADSLANAVAGNDTDITTLNTTQDSLENAISSNDTDIATLNTTQDSLENAISSNDTDIATLNTTQDSLENAISSNDTELDSIFARADSIINVLYWNNNAGVLSHDAGIDSVDVDGVLQVNGNSDLNGDLDASGAASIGGALDVTGVTTLSDSLNGTTADLSSDLDVDGNSTLDSTVVNEYFEATVDSFDMNSSKNGSISASDSLLVSAQVAATMAMDAITYADIILDSAATISATISPVMLQESSVSGDVSTEFSVDWVHSGVAFGDDLDALDNALQAVMTGGTLTEAGWISDAQGAGSMFYDAGTEYNAVIYADDTLKLITDTDGLVSITSDSTQVNSKLNVAEDADFDANVNIDGNSYTDGNADIDGTLDVNGNTDLDTTDIDGSLNVEDMATFQANVQINDSLNVTNDAHIGGDFQVDGDSDLDGTLDVDGDTEMDTVNIDGSLTVAQFADFNDSLDVAMSVNIQDNLDVNDSLRLNSAQNEGRILTVTDSQGGLGVTIETVNTSGSTSATTLTTHRLVVQDDAVYNGDLNVNGALAVTSNITSAAAPTSPNHITNKEYVDTRIAQAITPPQIWDYEAVGSTSGDTIFFINGDLLLYATEEDTQENYQMKFYGSDLDLTGDNAPETIQLRARGNVLNLNNSVNDVNFWTSGTGGTFNIGYTDIKALAGGQEDGYVSTTLTFVNVGGQEYTTGVVIRFYLDSENDAETGATFTIED